ncbi:unnamed protein product [Colias eurytheme]|nr:unnamed protein product [Colias eurytheme]
MNWDQRKVFVSNTVFNREAKQEVNQTQKYIQTSGLSLEKCVIKIKALKIFLQTQRIQIVERAISYATEKCEDLDISVERRGRRIFRRRMPGEMSQDVGLTLPDELHRAMLECLDRFYEELEHRYKAMDDILTTFGVVQKKTFVIWFQILQKSMMNFLQRTLFWRFYE